MSNECKCPKCGTLIDQSLIKYSRRISIAAEDKIRSMGYNEPIPFQKRNWYQYVNAVRAVIELKIGKPVSRIETEDDYLKALEFIESLSEPIR